jgi:3',5'-cyclic AMP phosphodiesterase CpdA
MTYTPTCHLLNVEPGLPDDWTLGAAQLAWLEDTLAHSTARWKFTFIHHTVGGNAGNDVDSAYGRGGGRAARIGEQATVHDMLRRYGVQIFFYAHDHVFTDMVVDGIHYTLPGSAGAPWKFDTSETGYTSYWPDSGYGRVKVSADHVTVDFVAMGGSVLASYTLP